jgi:Transcription-silencing protein, cryptic loci regulator Clr2
MSAARNTSAEAIQPSSDTTQSNNNPTQPSASPWTKILPNLYSITLSSKGVRQSELEEETTKDVNILLVTRTDGVHKIGSLSRPDKDVVFKDKTAPRQAYLCKVGSHLAAKAGISSGGNNPDDQVWDVLPEMLFGYEVFERRRDKSSATKWSDVYVMGHPTEGAAEHFFRTAEEFAEHLLWLAEGNDDKLCRCTLCTKELLKKKKTTTRRKVEDMKEERRAECAERTSAYLQSTRVGSYWGDLPELSGLQG